MNKWTIRKRLFASMGAMLVLTAVSGVFGFRTASGIQARLEETGHGTIAAIELASEIQGLLGGILNGERAAILAAYEKNSQQLEAARRQTAGQAKDLDVKLERLLKLMNQEGGRQACGRLREEMHAWRQVDEKLQAKLNGGQPLEAQRLADQESLPRVDAMKAAAGAALAIQKKSLEENNLAAKSSYETARLIIISVLALSVLVAGGVGWASRRISGTLDSIVSDLIERAEQMTTASTMVSSASNSLSQGATEQAASVEQTSSSMEEMSSMTRSNAENCQKAAELMSETSQLVEQSNQALSAMVASMQGIRNSSDKIAKIIKVIDEIAFQTNILALNAAVEAARAGEAGMGFAVVADEVRNLAQRSAQAAKDTASLIEEAINTSNDGDQKLQQVATSIHTITACSSRVQALVDQVNEASQHQTQGIDQVACALSQMSNVTQQTAANAEESAAAGDELSAHAESVRNIVRRLEALIGAASASHQAHSMDHDRMAV